jgi:hypothetical protein
MNIELLRKLADLRDQFDDLKKEFKQDGTFTPRIEGEVQTRISNLVGKDNLVIESRDSIDYPYEVYTQVEGIKVFALATTDNLVDFPQFKERRKALLLKQLAELESEVEATV